MLQMMNEKGSALLYSLIGLSIAIAGSVVMLQKTTDYKTMETDLAKTQTIRLFKRRMATLLHEPSVCEKNFKGKIVQTEISEMKNAKGDIIFKNRSKYYQNNITFNKIKLSPNLKINNHFLIDVEYSRIYGLNKKPVTQFIRFDMTATFDENNKIQTCKFDGRTAEDANEAFKKICHGPGMISNENLKCIIVNPKKPSIVLNCPEGQALSGIQNKGNSLEPSCKPMLQNASDCEYGLKFTGNSGQFKCLPLEEIVDKTKVTTSINKTCGIEVKNNKFKFGCN